MDSASISLDRFIVIDCFSIGKKQDNVRPFLARKLLIGGSGGAGLCVCGFPPPARGTSGTSRLSPSAGGTAKRSEGIVNPDGRP
jgi:hypothetical protein